MTLLHNRHSDIRTAEKMCQGVDAYQHLSKHSHVNMLGRDIVDRHEIT